MQIHVLVAPFLFYLSVTAPWKATEDGPDIWAPAPTQDPWIKLLIYGFGLFHPSLLQPIWGVGSSANQWKTCVCGGGGVLLLSL